MKRYAHAVEATVVRLADPVCIAVDPHGRGRLTGRFRRRAADGATDAGESLIEILLTVVITGLTVGALLAGLANAGEAGNVQRANVTGDKIMRNFAEATKAAARSCVAGGPLLVVSTEPGKYHAVISDPPTTPQCPSSTVATVLTLDVSGPSGLHETMQIAVRRP